MADGTPVDPVNSVFGKPTYGQNVGQPKKVEMPKGLWVKCPSCGEMLYKQELSANLMVCRKCTHHFPMTARERIASLVDDGTFEEFDPALVPVNALGFKTSSKDYVDYVKSQQEKTGMNEGVIAGTGTMDGAPLSLAVMDFSFIGGSMGSVVGEKITRAIERATARKLPVVVVCASGGARMQEGLFSLMQMAKTSAALHRHGQARLPFISVLTHPTMAGVMASFATLGDLIIAEPKALIGFAGARVIKETTQQDLPKGFQTSEFLLDRGLIDIVAPRPILKATLANALRYMTAGGTAATKTSSPTETPAS
ncbi:acetyl-CoA carboxylase carboxyl transferase subunit beta [Verrucomicrobia bacterium LW23]|nr:acetyl-CoA carboxylase carboxyl transferase subunit beta [Verrucomicrobia bacterium LW23]